MAVGTRSSVPEPHSEKMSTAEARNAIRQQTTQSVLALEGLLERLRELEGRKFVVWIAEELVSTDGSELFRVRSLAAEAQTSVHVILLKKPSRRTGSY